MPTETHCSRCGNVIPADSPGRLTVGYARDAENKTVCFACCALEDAAWMRNKGKITLYLILPSEFAVIGPRCGGRMGYRNAIGSKVTNWPGSLELKPYALKTGRHNIAGHRYDVWFKGPDGKEWHGVTYGNMTQICHCRRVRG